MRTTGCGGGRAACPAPARPVPRAPSSLWPPPTALQGRCRGDPSPPEALSTQQAEIAAEGHGLSHPGLGDSACQAATSHEDTTRPHRSSEGCAKPRHLRRPDAGQGDTGAPPWLRSPGQVEDSLTFPGPRPTLRSLPGRGLSGPLGSATSLLTPLRRHLRGSGRGQAARASPRLQSRPPLQDKTTQEGFESSTLYGAPPLPLSLSPPSPGQVYNSLWQEGTL